MFWEQFHKYVGIQGVLALLMVGGYLTSIFVKVVLPTGYSELMTMVLGFYFGKNGPGVIAAVRGR